MSSTSLRSKLRRQAGNLGSRRVNHLQDYAPVVNEEETGIDTYGNEIRTLGGTTAAFHRPWHKDKRWWVRWPAQLWQVTGQRFVPRQRNSEYRPSSHWWSRWLGKAWVWVQRHGGSTNNLVGPLLRSGNNWLLVFLPLGLGAFAGSTYPGVVFALNFLAVIPLSGLVYLACEDLSAHLGLIPGGLLVAFSDNLVELIVGIVALCMGEFRLVQASIIGSVLYYSLLIMGSCFVVHGVRFPEGDFNSFAMESITSLNLVALCFILIPSTWSMAGMNQNMGDYDRMMIISHGVSVILLLLYFSYLFFTLYTHSDAFNEVIEDEDGESMGEAAYTSLGPVSAVIWLAISLALVALCTIAIVSAVKNSMLELSAQFVGFVLLPLLGNITDCTSAWVVAAHNQLDITILVTIGSSLQLMLFTWPVLVILGWIINKPLVVNLSPFEAGAAFVGVFVSSGAVRNGKSNYLVGAMCIALYLIIALAAYVYPKEDPL